MKKLNKAIQYVEKHTGYKIIHKSEGNGRLLVGRTKSNKKIAYIYGDNCTQLCHELGHMLATPGLRPISKLSIMIREMEAWRAGEFLQDKFNIPFDEECFDEGMGSYIIDVINSEECPSKEWMFQFIGEN